MELINYFALVVGWAAIVVFFGIVVTSPLNVISTKDYLSVTYGKFGFVKAKNEELIKKLSDLRNVDRQTIFINAPEWFNKRIYNFGHRSKGVKV